MKQILIALLVVGSGSLAFAQQAKVVKVKGSQAIVQFPPGASPEIGQLLQIGDADPSGGASSFDTGPAARGGRTQTIAATAAINMLSTTVDSTGNTPATVSSTGLSLTGRYGWNKIQMEYGPLANFEYLSSSSSRRISLLGGGFYDYNLVPNNGTNSMVYGLGAEGGFGIISGSNTSSSATATRDVSGTDLKIAAGGFLKWFTPKLPVAIRGDLQYSYDKRTENYSGGNSPSSTFTTTISGIVMKAGFQVYF